MKRIHGLLLLLVFGSANAALIDNGTSMIDTGTGLEWLDLTQTLGISWNAAEASTFVTVDGYAHASEAQVIALFTNAGFLTTNNVNNVLNNPAASTLLSFLGCTQFCATVNATGRGFASWSVTQTTRPNYHMSGLGAGAATTSLLSSNFNLVDTTAGHFLVRPVPVPATVWLFGSALGLLGWARRRIT
ncbi:MAG: PEP-CTERM sorting domain-containing protein [Gammaproteobacteria bacterium]